MHNQNGWYILRGQGWPEPSVCSDKLSLVNVDSS